MFKALALEDIKKLFRPGPEDQKVLIDVKGLYPLRELQNTDLRWWRL